MNVSERSYQRITKADLKRLLALSNQDRDEFFARNPRWRRLYANRIICIALCQGAALHYLNGKNGVKDFDVWTFYSEHPDAPFPYRRMGHKDFGMSKFGIHPSDIGRFEGRCIDLLGRSLKIPKSADPVKALESYLANPTTQSAKELGKKAVILLHPKILFGRIIWAEESSQSNSKQWAIPTPL